MDTIVERLVTYISETNYDVLPKDVIEETKKFILDTLGVGLAGAREPGCKEVVDLVKKWSSNNDGSTIIYYGDRVSPPEAAFANSVMMHALDFDDTLHMFHPFRLLLQWLNRKERLMEKNLLLL
jgi:2-methylcitrate dehydratase PrpD